MYHGVGRRPEPASRFVIPEARFRRQLAWLKRRKYSVLSLDEFVKYRVEYRLPPAKSVVITFDDGYADNFEIALPCSSSSAFLPRFSWSRTRTGPQPGRAFPSSNSAD